MVDLVFDNDLMTDSKEGYPRSIITQIPVMNNLTC